MPEAPRPEAARRRPASFLALLRASALVSLSAFALAVIAWLGWRWFSDWLGR